MRFVVPRLMRDSDLESMQRDLFRDAMIDRLAPLVIVILSIPLFLINTESIPGWADSALYLKEAIHIAEGRSLHNLGYMYNDAFAGLSPSAYPVGWPLLLAPFYAIFGLDFHAFHLLTSGLLVISGIVFFKVFRRYLAPPLAFGGVLLTLYHPYVLLLKGHILSEIPFTLFVFLTLLAYLKEWHRHRPVIMLMLATMTLLVRPVGITLLAAICASELCTFVAQRRNGQTARLRDSGLLRCGLISAGACLGYYLVNYVIFKLPESGGYFEQILTANEMGLGLGERLDYYRDQLQSYYQFRPMSNLTQPLKYTLMVATAVGVFYKPNRDIPNVFVFFGALCFVAVAVFPHIQDLRHFYVLLPAISLFTMKGLQVLDLRYRALNYLKWSFVVIGVIICYRSHYAFNEARMPKLDAGPNSTLAREVWEDLRTRTSPDDVICFVSPRSLALHADRPSLHHGREAPDKIHEHLRNVNANLILINDWITTPFLDRYLANYGDQYDTVWVKHRYTLLQYRQR